MLSEAWLPWKRASDVKHEVIISFFARPEVKSHFVAQFVINAFQPPRDLRIHTAEDLTRIAIFPRTRQPNFQKLFLTVRSPIVDLEPFLGNVLSLNVRTQMYAPGSTQLLIHCGIFSQYCRFSEQIICLGRSLAISIANSWLLCNIPWGSEKLIAKSRIMDGICFGVSAELEYRFLENLTSALRN